MSTLSAPPDPPARPFDLVIAGGKVVLPSGAVTTNIGIANGLKPDRFGWLTPVKVSSEQPVSV